MWLMTFLNLTDIMSDIVIVGLQDRPKRYGHAMRRLTYPCNTSDGPLIVLDQNGWPYLSLNRVVLAGERVLRSYIRMDLKIWLLHLLT